MNDQRVLGQLETLKNTGTVELSTSRGKPHSVSTDPELEVQWDEVEGMGLARVSRSTMVAMKLTPSGYERYESRLTGTTRRLAKANERMMGEDMIALPATIGKGPQELVALLGLAHGQYGPPEVREQYARRQAEAQAEADANAAARDPRAERPRASDSQE
ncbi:MAG: hypothetical protein L0G85_09570 [Kocuria sp.]|nr:hypothetical protein [Kocuria sp.]